MITLEDFAAVPSRVRGAYVAVGNFDGVHRGHAHLLSRLRSRADAAGAPALALTFDHRVIDGAYATRCIVRINELLETVDCHRASP